MNDSQKSFSYYGDAEYYGNRSGGVAYSNGYDADFSGNGGAQYLGGPSYKNELGGSNYETKTVPLPNSKSSNEAIAKLRIFGWEFVNPEITQENRNMFPCEFRRDTHKRGYDRLERLEKEYCNLSKPLNYGAVEVWQTNTGNNKYLRQKYVGDSIFVRLISVILAVAMVVLGVYAPQIIDLGLGYLLGYLSIDTIPYLALSTLASQYICYGVGIAYTAYSALNFVLLILMKASISLKEKNAEHKVSVKQRKFNQSCRDNRAETQKRMRDILQEASRISGYNQ